MAWHSFVVGNFSRYAVVPYVQLCAIITSSFIIGVVLFNYIAEKHHMVTNKVRKVLSTIAVLFYACWLAFMMTTLRNEPGALTLYTGFWIFSFLFAAMIATTDDDTTVSK